ncbi:glycogen synthase GlgA [Sphingomonas sp.]|uniref:glycogen synthase GlgA n=1 Tax=Sphingomonas sp. TaxID=28214 RepID=UPI003AFFA0EB
MTTSVLSVASEVYPLVKTGGLADVAGALPGALARHGVAMRTLVPGYPPVLAALEGASEAASLDAIPGGPARLLAARAAGLDLLVLDAPQLFTRDGGPYADATARDWPDNALRFACLSAAAAAIAAGAIPGWRPELVHAHDWQAGLAPAYLYYGGVDVPSVLTVHNLAFQGRFEPALLPELGLPDTAMTIDGVEYFGGIGFLKAGLRFATRVTTVSPSYAREIATEAGGVGLGGLIAARGRDVTGILNGIDTTVWDPARDPLIARPYTRHRLAGRAANRAALGAAFGLEADDGPLFGVVSRLSQQKGLDLLLDALPALVSDGGRLALIGAGDPALERGFAQAAAAHPGRVGVFIGYDEARAHQMQAGADALLVPSRFEPCGLTQLCALRYGCVPVVARTGGLADTVIDANPAALSAGVATGVQFAPDDAGALLHAIGRTTTLHRDKAAWRRLRANGMAADISWDAPAAAYARLYREARQAGRPAA